MNVKNRDTNFFFFFSKGSLFPFIPSYFENCIMCKCLQFIIIMQFKFLESILRREDCSLTHIYIILYILSSLPNKYAAGINSNRSNS